MSKKYYDKDENEIEAPDKAKVPIGYEECHAIIGFDSDGHLRISETDEEWEPDECERSFFVGNVQRLVFYHYAREKRHQTPIQYLIMDNYSINARQFYHVKDNKPEPHVPTIDNTSEYINQRNTYPTPNEYFLRVGQALPIKDDEETIDYFADIKREELPKTADSLLSELLKKPVKTIFDKD